MIFAHVSVILLLSLSASSSLSGDEEDGSSFPSSGAGGGSEDSYILSEDGSLLVFNSEDYYYDLGESGSGSHSNGEEFSASGELPGEETFFEGSSDNGMWTVTTPIPTTSTTILPTTTTILPTTTTTLSVNVDFQSGNCAAFPFGCCINTTLPSHSLSGQGCCISVGGCCPDFETLQPADGGECTCSETAGGCCRDGVSYASLGCRCTESVHGCCPDQYTEASGPDFEGCSCQTFPHGCCEDGVTPDDGEVSCQNISSNCILSEFGCCPDGETLALSASVEEGCGCESSEFGCCPDGKTQAKGERFEGCESKPGDVCYMKKDPGACRSYNITRMWYFDINYGGCSQFWFGGCGGNGNRFESRKECESSCVDPPGVTKCYLPRVSGPASCTSNLANYYFDQETTECLSFTYNGCLGNSNRFATESDCQGECMKAVKRPRSEDPCRQAVEPGPCNGYFSLWYYDEARGECATFVYGGCKGNKNKFLSKEACQNSCKHMLHTLQVKNRCRRPGMLHRDGSHCDDPSSVVPKWYFDEDIHSCVPFYLSISPDGQCGSVLMEEVFSEGSGNKTLFDSLRDCASVCPNIYAPHLSVSNHDVVVKEEEAALLQMQISANPPPNITWNFNGSELSSSDPRISMDPSGSLRIYPAKTSDSGNWTVSAFNGIGSGFSEMIILQVNPTDAPIQVHIHQKGGNPHQIGSNIRLDCEVSGFPVPSVNWYKNNARLPNSGRVRWSKKTKELVIENANLIDSGYYTCRAWNFRESSHDSRNIQVEKSKHKIECVDRPWLARCELIVRGQFCLRDPMYFQICCHSCTTAGLIYNP